MWVADFILLFKVQSLILRQKDQLSLIIGLNFSELEQKNGSNLKCGFNIQIRKWRWNFCF